MFVFLFRDVRFALRTWRRQPTFPLAAIAILSLGIGAAVAVFSILDGTLLRPLPYPQADRLVLLGRSWQPVPLFQHWQASLRSVESLAAARGTRSVDLTGGTAPARVLVAEVSSGFFSLFGATPAAGRLLGQEDFETRDRRVVLSHELWQRRWAGDPALVGKSITLAGERWVVVGVMDPSFVPPARVTGEHVDLWMPLLPPTAEVHNWRAHTLAVAGRLRQGFDPTSALAELRQIDQALSALFPEHRKTRDGRAKLTELLPLKSATVGEARGGLWLIGVAVLAMLLIGCANLASLFLVHGRQRRHELALRTALGASSRRLMAQAVIEALCLALVGGGLGVILAGAGLSLFVTLQPIDLPRLHEIGLDARILVFSLLMMVMTGLVIGLAPALQAARLSASGVLAGGADRLRVGPRSHGVLVIGEIAITLPLLAIAVLMFQGLLQLTSIEPGFRPETRTRIELHLPDSYTPERRQRFTQSLVEQLEEIAGVTAVAAGWTVPFDMVDGSRCCLQSHVAELGNGEPVSVMVHPVTPGYLRVLGARLLRGRGFERKDADPTPIPTVINRALARQLVKTEDAVGRFLSLSGPRPMELEVVGVVDDLRYWSLVEPVDPAVYIPYARLGGLLGELRAIVQSPRELTPDFAEALRASVWSVDPNVPLAEIETMSTRISHVLRRPRFYAMSLGLFALLGLLITAVGLSSTLFHAVTRRRGELAIRLALGAGRGDLVWLVLRQGAVLIVAGMSAGLGLSLLISRGLKGVVYGMEALGAEVILGSFILFAASALVAMLLPALQAARCVPGTVLKSL